MVKTWWGLGVAGVVVLGGLGVFGLSASGNVPFGLDRVVFVQPESTPAWVQRIALVDEALGRSELNRAVYEWREAYGAALRNGSPTALIAVGDRAIRIAERGGPSGYFRREAGQMYMHAALRARIERSRATLLEIVERLEQIGERSQAEQVRRMVGSLS